MMNRIAIHGLGYVGLTAALHWARAGWQVTAYDPDEVTILALRQCEPRAGEFLAYINDDIGAYVRSGQIIPTTRLEATYDCQVHIIAVPTERDGGPYDGIVLGVIETLMARSIKGAMILVESTLTPGTIDRVLVKAGVREALEEGRFLAVCPRRDWFADEGKNLATLPRVVGGVTPACTYAVAALLRSEVSKTVHETDYRTAEITKALENAWLHALVMLPTELALERPDLNIAEATRLASTHWRMPNIFLSAGCGGRCVPLGTRYLKGLSNATHSVLRAVDETEGSIRRGCAHAFSRRGCKSVLVLGAAYRPNFKDAGNSPGLDVARLLEERSIATTVDDPLWSEEGLDSLRGWTVTASRDLAPDAIFLATPHEEYKERPSDEVLESIRFILDATGLWSEHAEHFAKSGVEYRQVGSPGWLLG